NGNAEEAYDDDDYASSEGMPDEDINFTLHYALHTFIATVEGQASVMKGDSLILLDDTNSYWWLVKVLKTEEVGYIPAENIETPFERLARLNKYRNVDLAAATMEERHQAFAQPGNYNNHNNYNNNSNNASGGGGDDFGGDEKRRVIFAEPTYVDHPGKTWSDTSGEESGSDEDPGSADEDAPAGSAAGVGIDPDEMEPDDGMEWDDTAVREERERRRRLAEAQQPPQRPMVQQSPAHLEHQEQSGMVGETRMDPAELRPDQEPKRITMTPAVAQTGGPQQQQQHQSPGQPVQQRQPQSEQEVRHHQQQQQYQQQMHQQMQQQQMHGQQQDSRLANGHGPVTNGRPYAGQQQPRERDASGASSLGGTSINTQGSFRSMSTSPDSSAGRDDDEAGRKPGKKDKKNGEESGTIVKKKRSGVFSGLFGKKKDKDKKNKDERSGSFTEGSSAASFESERQSHDYPSRLQDSPDIRMPSRVTSPPMQMQGDRNPSPFQPARPAYSSGSGQNSPSAVSPQGIRLQQIDQQQQALYQQYMARSPGSSPPIDASRAYGTQAAATVAQSSAAQRLARATGSHNGARPGSIILNPANSHGGPLLNVLRIFSGEHVDTQYTFKTVLLNDTTTSRDLVKQALQRFRVEGARESDLDEYFLTIKEVGGEELALGSGQRPLQAFNMMCQRIGEEQDAMTRTVKRSSVGSISSISSNLSMHPAIAKLSLNDFSDDSNVKLFLNRRPRDREPTSYFGDYGAETPPNQQDDAYADSPTLSNGQAAGLPPSDSITSPSARFTLHVVAELGDLPDGMMFDPQSEAILPRSMVKERSATQQSPRLPPDEARQRYLLLSRTATVAEAIESALERFGITEGVVDGGDDVEDKVGKRRSMLRVRYGLGVRTQHGDGEFMPQSKLMDAYDVPPIFKIADKSVTNRRRSREWARELSAQEHDLRPTDPVFFLRRIGPRTVGMSNPEKLPMDEVALKQRRVSDAAAPEAPTERAKTPQEIIAEQRAATKARQTAILSTHPNADQGIDVVVADRGVVRSSRSSMMGQDEVRYSYISEEGETFDISQYVHDEWVDVEVDNDAKVEELRANDLLHTIVKKSERGAGQGYIVEKIDQVISKVNHDRDQPQRNTPTPQLPSIGQSLASVSEDRVRDQRSLSPSSDLYGPAIRESTMSPQLEPIPSSIRQAVDEAPSRSASRQANNSPLLEGGLKSAGFASKLSHQIRAAGGSRHQRAQPSIASILSDVSTSAPRRDVAPPTSGSSIAARYARSAAPLSQTWAKPKTPVRNKDDFGFSSLVGVIQARADRARPPRPEKPELSAIDKRWFGPSLTPRQINQLPPSLRRDYLQTSKKIEDLETETADLMKKIVALRVRERKQKETAARGEAAEIEGNDVTTT
ncbi:hypothetical protein HD553DRAFT_268648, partial [Filobasidium floriforme]|uniref:uncharacterized protein n=1 Tax=Filobasidium floriforme TaxID=5210 RepID=UPI001E8EB351